MLPSFPPWKMIFPGRRMKRETDRKNRVRSIGKTSWAFSMQKYLGHKSEMDQLQFVRHEGYYYTVAAPFHTAKLQICKVYLLLENYFRCIENHRVTE